MSAPRNRSAIDPLSFKVLLNQLVGVVSAKKIEAASVSEESVRAQKLLAAKHIGSPFLKLDPISAGESLSAFIKKKIDSEETFSLQQLKIIIAELILALEVLHKNNIAYRDLSPDHFLISIVNKVPVLQLAYFDFIEEVDDKDTAVRDDIDLVVNPLFSDPSLIALLDRDPSQPAEIDYRKDLKKIDCFALGKILEIVFEPLLEPLLEPLSEPLLADHADEYKHCIDLVPSLTSSQLNQRAAIEQAKESVLFGETKEQRETFFAAVQLDAELAVFPSLLGDALWKIYERIEKIEREFAAGSAPDNSQAVMLAERVGEYQGDPGVKAVLAEIGLLVSKLAEIAETQALLKAIEGAKNQFLKKLSDEKLTKTTSLFINRKKIFFDSEASRFIATLRAAPTFDKLFSEIETALAPTSTQLFLSEFAPSLKSALKNFSEKIEKDPRFSPRVKAQLKKALAPVQRLRK